MTKGNNAEQAQNQDPNEIAEFQNSVTREFVEEHTGTFIVKGSVNESTARVSDDQNRLITKRNMRK
ncbi:MULTISPECIES: hypothetical protein [unclassified Paenibacillus]|uniref:hypothetical protein n=1 Tax=unclassified Paenibacillus TaxID=185978 RepID=UPI0004F737F5|nr:hypothetical protein [Paenibacillus sp. FSL R5-0345]AIQ36808.1 hypothetical protein R50345_20490 [Paenibacillus sp. FSL R5-0345]